MPNPLENKRIVLGVTGSIACYKAIDLASKLTQQDALVDVVMTSAACNFVTPLSYSSITHRPVFVDLFNVKSELTGDHVTLAEMADIVVVAPATANTIGKIAWGLANDALTCTILATQAPVILCPAMDGHMFDNVATQDNLARLKDRGHVIAGPIEGRLASGMTGTGRLIETPEILGYIRMILGQCGDLMDMKIIVTAGGTQESIDPIRFIANRSSGKMGYALAEAARDRGAKVTLVAAPNVLPDPVGVKIVRVTTAMEMNGVVQKVCSGADALIMAAAVADWRYETVSEKKLKKGDLNSWAMNLVRTPDVLAEVKNGGLVKIGFAAETEDVLDNARAKLDGKNLDLIIANEITDIHNAFGSETNKVTIIDRGGGVDKLDLMTKYDVAWHILNRLTAIKGSSGQN